MVRTIDVKKKICLLGDGAVGKTSLIRRFVLDEFDDDYIMTMGAKVSKKTIPVKYGVGTPKETHVCINLSIWDLLGQVDESIQRVQPIYYRGSEGALFVADVTRVETKEHMNFWVESIYDVTDEIPSIFLLNKIDLEEKAQYSLQDFGTVAKKYDSAYYPTSAKTGLNVETVFYELARMLANKYVDPELVTAAEETAETKATKRGVEIEEITKSMSLFDKREAVASDADADADADADMDTDTDAKTAKESGAGAETGVKNAEGKSDAPGSMDFLAKIRSLTHMEDMDEEEREEQAQEPEPKEAPQQSRPAASGGAGAKPEAPQAGRTAQREMDRRLRKRQQTLNARKEKLDQREEELNAREEELAEKEIEVEEREMALLDREFELEELKEKLDRRDEEQHEMQRRLKRDREALAEMRKTLEKRKQVLDRREEELAARDTALATREASRAEAATETGVASRASPPPSSTPSSPSSLSSASAPSSPTATEAPETPSTPPKPSMTPSSASMQDLGAMPGTGTGTEAEMEVEMEAEMEAETETKMEKGVEATGITQEKRAEPQTAKTGGSEVEDQTAGALKVCPECHETVDATAVTCQSCGHVMADFSQLKSKLQFLSKRMGSDAAEAPTASSGAASETAEAQPAPAAVAGAEVAGHTEPSTTTEAPTPSSSTAPSIVQIKCPKCKKTIRLEAESFPLKVKCAHCGARGVIKHPPQKAAAKKKAS